MTDEQRKSLEKEVFKYLDVSTGNLPKLEFDAINKTHNESGLIGDPHEYGVWVYVPEEDDMEHVQPHPHLLAIVNAARELGCRWVNFDQDADFLEGFPEFEW